jgi:rubredoxin
MRPCNLVKHEKVCKNRRKEATTSSLKFEQVDNKFKCPVCGSLRSKQGIKNHYWRSHTEEGREFVMAQAMKRKPSNQYIKAAELSLPPPRLTESARKKISLQNKKRTREWRIENGKKVSATIHEKVARGEWHTSLAKRMHYSYNGVDLHGKWELAYAMFLDRKEITWKRCKDRFAYEFEGKSRFYTPDFYLPKTKEYVEIKGYKTKKDEAKWSQFPHTLLVLRGRELKLLLAEFEDLNSMVKL